MALTLLQCRSWFIVGHPAIHECLRTKRERHLDLGSLFDLCFDLLYLLYLSIEHELFDDYLELDVFILQDFSVAVFDLLCLVFVLVILVFAFACALSVAHSGIPALNAFPSHRVHS